jgi:hypothetical protein
MTAQQEWLNKRCAEIRLRRKPTRQQKGLLELAELSSRTKKQNSALAALIEAEKADDLRIAKASAAQIELKDSKKDTKSAARKARDHELMKAAGLMSLAGLLDKKTGITKIDPDVLVGMMQSLSRLTEKDKRWNDWKSRGAALLTEASARSKTKVVAAPVSESEVLLLLEAEKAPHDEARPPAVAAATTPKSVVAMTREEMKKQGLI